MTHMNCSVSVSDGDNDISEDFALVHTEVTIPTPDFTGLRRLMTSCSHKFVFPFFLPAPPPPPFSNSMTHSKTLC